VGCPSVAGPFVDLEREPSRSVPEPGRAAPPARGAATWRGVRSWIADERAAELAEQELVELLAVDADASGRVLRRVPGRETFARAARGSWTVVKRARGDSLREGCHALLHGRLPRSPARREAENLTALAADGFAVPRAVAWIEGRRAPWPAARTSAVVMTFVHHDDDLRGALAEPVARARRRRLDELVALVARLHDRGWYHRDLYLEHVVLAAGGPVLLDVGRARRARRVRRRWFVKDLAALAASAPDAVGRAERVRFLRDYLVRRGLAREGALRRWACSVQRKERRLRAHRPRHVDPASARVPRLEELG